jgi:hypothetical protein
MVEFQVLQFDIPSPSRRHHTGAVTHRALAAAGDANVQNPVNQRFNGIKDLAYVNFLYMGLFGRIEDSGG